MDSTDILDDKDSGPEVQINIPSSVMSRIEELMGGTEQFDSPDFDAVSYINRVFPTEQSLAGVEGMAARCEFRLASVQHDARRLVRAQPARRAAARAALSHAQRAIHDLALQVADINKKAERSESMVREITSEIKQLDCAKSNLTAAITTLNHFHMLVGGVDALRTMTHRRQYKEIVLPLQAIMEVLQHFECYREIREINALRDEVHATRSMLAAQILADFKEALSGPRGGGGGAGGGAPHRTLAEACAVVDVLEPKVKQDLLKWFISLQLQEYCHLFSAEQECAWLAHVERRYSWLKKHLLALEDGLGLVFPPAWRLSERLAHQFCKMTREQLGAQLAARRDELDVKLLLYAIHKTYSFEQLLHKRFVGTELPEGAELRATDLQADFDDLMEQFSGAQTEEGGATRRASPWRSQVGACFEPYLYLYINSLDRNLAELMQRFTQDAKAQSTTVDASGTSSGAVMSSCADLFLFYKKCLVQCVRLSTGEPIRELAGVFQKYLRMYAAEVLAGALPRGAGGPAGPAGLVTNLHGLLRDDSATRYTRAEISKITSVITTAEYCLETSIHLEQKLKEKDLELSCEPALAAMAKLPWAHVAAVGDQSAYVAQLVTTLRGAVPALRDALASSRKYFTQFCIRFANSFIPKFIQNIYRCKPISTVGSEQLLLDTHMLKTALLELPSIGSDVKRPAPATYTKVVIKLMTKAEMILKLVMAPLEGGAGGTGGAEGFVGQFCAQLGECSLAEFHKVLDMKGARVQRGQRAALDQLFRDTCRALGAAGK